MEQPTIGALGWNSLGWNLDHWMQDLWNSDYDSSKSSTSNDLNDEDDDWKSDNLISNDYSWDWKRSTFFPLEDRELPNFAIIY